MLRMAFARFGMSIVLPRGRAGPLPTTPMSLATSPITSPLKPGTSGVSTSSWTGRWRSRWRMCCCDRCPELLNTTVCLTLEQHVSSWIWMYHYESNWIKHVHSYCRNHDAGYSSVTWTSEGVDFFRSIWYREGNLWQRKQSDAHRFKPANKSICTHIGRLWDSQEVDGQDDRTVRTYLIQLDPSWYT